MRQRSATMEKKLGFFGSRNLPFLVSFLSLFCSHKKSAVLAWRQCPMDRGGGICPDHGTCCPTNTPGVSSCITGKETEPLDQGDCCPALHATTMITGCPFGFRCAVPNHGSSISTGNLNSSSGSNGTTTLTNTITQHPYYCQRRGDAPDWAFPQHQLKRYHLCSIPKDRHDILQEVHGFPIPGRRDDETTTTTTPRADDTSLPSVWQLAYYSNMKSITQPNDEHLGVYTAWIVIHGSGRNADDYLCTAMASLLASRSNSSNKNILVIAPWFAAPEDGPIKLANQDASGDDNMLQWIDHGPVPHTWRYGADSIQGGISSYETVDAIVGYLSHAQAQFPNLRHIVVAGHSAGGQFVHRWALLSNSPVWGDTHENMGAVQVGTRTTRSQDSTTTIVSTTEASTLRLRSQRQDFDEQLLQEQGRSLTLRVVVANSRSYCYMDHRRTFGNNGTLQTPDPKLIASCPAYNTWQWGLDDGGILEPVPYKDRAVIETPRSVLTHRYTTRHVHYLLGEYDTIPLGDTCMTELFQGPTRLERGHNFVQALELYFGHPVHDQSVASKSPHDHCYMFQSPQGQHALFGGISLQEQV
jgi:hypothetical protein